MHKQNVLFWETENRKFTVQSALKLSKVLCSFLKENKHDLLFFYEQTFTGATFLNFLNLCLMIHLQEVTDNFVIQMDGAHHSGWIKCEITSMNTFLTDRLDKPRITTRVVKPEKFSVSTRGQTGNFSVKLKTWYIASYIFFKKSFILGNKAIFWVYNQRS